MSPPHLGVWLVTLGFISKRQLAQALENEMITQQPLDAVLESQRLLTREEIEGAIALQEQLGRASSLGDVGVEAEVLALVPRPLALREKVLPLMLIGERLIVAYARSRSRQDEVNRLLDQVAQVTGLMLHGVPFPQEEIEKAIAHHYDPISARKLVSRAVETVVPARTGSVKQVLEVAAPAGEGDAPIINLVNQILTQAVERGASDLHVRPTNHELEVKLRLDGVLHTLMTLPKEVESAVIARLKVMADLNIAEHRRPQDGRFSIQVAGKPIDLRVACICSHWGEMMVLRILRPLNLPHGFTSLGFRGSELERWQRITQAPNGLILVTGPTGSGKTSTLYATLNTFDRNERNILTVEDPVEYPVPGIGQIPIANQAGVTFGAALRSILRLDPDVILVGEIRDQETLTIALEAAMTGHLVLSTLHTNDAVSAIARMAEMGAPRHQIAATLVGVLAQRLVRRICPHCCQSMPASEADRHFVGHESAEPLVLSYGAGCEVCAGIGYKGRVGVYEIFENDAELADLIAHETPTHTIWRAARQHGMGSLLTDGKAKVLAQQTTVAEVQRVIGARERAE